MTVGLVIVSHSARIAEGVAELAGQMADGVAIEPAGGTDDGGIGTSFDRVTAALQRAESGDGVVVLCDLGSAQLTAETALEFADAPERIRIADAPLVEGAVTAAVAARVGGDLDAVLAAAESARGGATGSVRGGGAASVDEHPRLRTESDPRTAERTVVLSNRSGLHARPAAEFVRTASGFDARVTVNDVDATSLLGIMGLGATRGTEVRIAAVGADAERAVDGLVALVESGFGED